VGGVVELERLGSLAPRAVGVEVVGELGQFGGVGQVLRRGVGAYWVGSVSRFISSY